MLDQGRSPGETCAVGREHDEIAIFNTPSLDRIHVADHHVGFLQMTVVQAAHGEFFGRNLKGLAESFQVPGGEGGIDEEGDVLHLFADLLEDAEHDLAEHEQVDRDQFFVEPLDVAADMEPARILTADVLGFAVVNAGNNPHVVEPPNGGDLDTQNAALGHILFQNHRAAAV